MGLHKLEQSTHKEPGQGRWLLPAIILLVAVILLFGGDSAREWLRFDRAGIGDGELWRLVSGHLVHLGWPHFALNAAGLVLVWYLVGDAFDRARWLLICAVSLLTMDTGFWILSPELGWYVGLSGLLHGVFAAGLVVGLTRGHKEAYILAGLLLAKLAWEQFSGPLPGSEGTTGGPVVVDAHLYGALGGVLGAILARIRVRPAASI